MKIVINDESVNPQRPYEHLQPIVEFLIATGNELSKGTQGFYATQGGWECIFRKPLDYAAITARFALPKSIRLGADENGLFCDRSWAAIYGSTP